MADSTILTLIAIALIVAWLIRMYNRFIKYRNGMEEAWSGIDVALKQRANLIPNLMRTVRGYTSYESGTLESVTAQRAPAGEIGERTAAEDQISASLNGLLAVAESYPELKADATFLELQRNLTETENQILAARQRYNGAVRRFNTQVQSFPSNLMASVFNFRPAPYFEISLATQRALPEVDL